MDKTKMPFNEHRHELMKSKQPPHVAEDVKRGRKMLGEHMREERAEIDRSYCNPAKDSH